MNARGKKQPPSDEEEFWRRLDALPRDATFEQMQWERDKILCGLLESDVPLSQGTRRQAAGDLRAYYAGIPLKQWRKHQHQVGFVRMMIAGKRNLRRRDKISAPDAEE